MNRAAVAAALLVAPGLTGLAAQEPPATGREAAEGLAVPPLEFDPPEATMHRLPGGVEVLHLEDRTLPLVDLLVRFEGGSTYVPRTYFAAAVALPALLRNGGTGLLEPDSVEALFDTWAAQTSFGGGGRSAFASLNVLTRHLAPALDLWGKVLRNPGLDPDEVEVWRGREMETVRRRADDPGILAFSEFNHLMYGDHPVGWQMTPADLEPADLSLERLEWVHRRVFCRDNMVLGVAGDVSWDDVEPLLRAMVEGWPACAEPLPDPPLAELRAGGGVFLIPRELNQSTVVMAHASDVRLADDETYFASRIANSILGSGGFRSRLMARVRTEEGYAYSASSLWTTPRRSQGLVGAVTRTRSDRTVAAVRAMLDVFGRMRAEPPELDEVRAAVDQYANGFVFNFEAPAQIVSRQMVYRLDDLPGDWLQRYLAGIQEVSPEGVHEVVRSQVRPEDMVILVVGDPDAFDEPLDVLGPVTVLDVPGGAGAGGDATPDAPSGAPRSPG